jgi:hypothetical protein
MIFAEQVHSTFGFHEPVSLAGGLRQTQLHLTFGIFTPRIKRLKAKTFSRDMRLPWTVLKKTLTIILIIS